MTTAHSAAHRTFDCPWCGAIVQVDASQVGDHFACPECKRQTKLTSSNTSDRPPTAPPPDAPHLTGDRTFDCPWCGAISSVPSAHLGERFLCPECRRETKLTATNARRAPVTAPPPDAPPAAPPPAKGALVAMAVVAVLAALGLWMAFSSGGGGGDGSTDGGSPPDEKASATMRPPMPRPPPDGPPPMPSPPPREPDASATLSPTPPSDAPAMPTPPPPPAESSPLLDKAKADVAAATVLLAEKSKAHGEAVAALLKWSSENPEYVAAVSDRRALGEIVAESKRVLEAKQVVPNPEEPKPDQVRAYNAAIAAYVEASPDRVRVAEALVVRLREDPATAGEVSDRTWKQLHYWGTGVRRGMAAAETALADRLGSLVPVELTKAADGAEAEVAAAERARLEAEARLAKLETETAPPK